MQVRRDEDVGQLSGVALECPHGTALDQVGVDALELFPAVEPAVGLYDFVKQAGHFSFSLLAVGWRAQKWFDAPV
jgi:hypothetical protein